MSPLEKGDTKGVVTAPNYSVYLVIDYSLLIIGYSKISIINIQQEISNFQLPGAKKYEAANILLFIPNSFCVGRNTATPLFHSPPAGGDSMTAIL
ncbi:MAG: hypothetical protein K9M80_09505 [Candidatus Marinimicrobia bacterium]|nr:hypothetical protein [Candidatus Neomarinimicrobiota bacterium]